MSKQKHTPKVKYTKPEIMEEKIWDTITDKAKTRFDYEAFAKTFPEMDELFTENILFEIILYFASGETEDVIAAKLHNELLIIGLLWASKEIEKFINDKKDLLKVEIFAAGLANDMLKNGDDPLTVLQAVNLLLM